MRENMVYENGEGGEQGGVEQRVFNIILSHLQLQLMSRILPYPF
jgi:hypothetical protein